VNLALFAFLGSLAALAYTFAGYPLLLALWARISSRPVKRSPVEPNVVIVVAVHNGANLIERKIATCLQQDYPAERLRILIASDGSDDRTHEIVTSLNHDRVDLLPFPARRGKAACLNDAIATCSEDILVLTDARQAMHPQAVRRLIENFADPAIGAVSGQLEFEREGITDFGEGIDAYWRYEKFLRRTESSIHSSVGVTGAIYALRRICFRPVPAETILDDVLIPMNTVAQGYRVIFENDAIAYDRPSRDAAQEKVRKVRTLAGNFQLLAAYPWLLAPWRNPIWLQFVSHKLMRLLAPLAMAVALLANAILAADPAGGVLSRLTFAAQLAAYALAFLGLTSTAANRLRPVKLASAFLSLNWFVVLGFFEFLSNRNAHLWQNHQQSADRSRSIN
jgi:biofilm PGA synthesis N-glycosyltransferase PgaC